MTVWQMWGHSISICLKRESATMYIMKLHYFSSELKKATSFRNALENNILCVGSFLVPHTHSLGLAGKGNPVHFLASFSHLFKKQVFSSELDPTCNSKPPKPGLTKEYAHWTLIFWSTLMMIDQLCRENSLITIQRTLTKFSFQVKRVGVQRKLCIYSTARFEEKYEISKIRFYLWLLEECVPLSAFPPSQMCIKPIHTDVHVSGLIKK